MRFQVMTSNPIYFENKTNSKWIALVNTTIAPLWYTTKQWFSVALITTGVLWGSVQFNTQHGIFPLFIAIPVSVGVTWTYLSGLAFATAITKSNWRSNAMIIVGALTEALFSILFVAGKYDLIPEKPQDSLALTLVLAHTIPLILLLVIYTYCKRDYLNEIYATQQLENIRIQAIEDDTLAYNRKVRDAKLKLILAREEIKLQELTNDVVVKSKQLKTCDNCGTMLENAQYAAMKRYGTCANCKK